MSEGIRQRPLNPAALRSSISELRSALKGECSFRPNDRTLETLARRTIRAYLAETQNAKSTNFSRLAVETRQFAAMEIGEEVVCPVAAPQTFYARFKTARKLMGNPEARFSIEVGPRNCVVKRHEDNATRQQAPTPWRNTTAIALARIPVGTGVVIPAIKDRRYLDQAVKLSARRILGNMAAEWKSKTTPEGVQITRTK